MKKKNPVILSSEKDGKIIYIEFVDGKKYKLQHPGNLMYIEWQKEYYNPTDGIDMAILLNKGFQYVVIPVGHDFQPSIEDIKPNEVEAWAITLGRFLSGKLDAPPAGYREKVNGRRNPGETAG